MTEIKRQATTAHSFGLEMELLSPQEAQKLWPVMDISDVVGAAFLPTDGQVNPADITQSLAKGARQNGVKIIEEMTVTGILIEKGRAVGVEDRRRATIKAEVVVNCGGQWAREIGALAGVSVPLTSVQHQYLVTEAIPGVPKNLPTLRDPGPPDLFQGRGRRPGDGRLRAQSEAVADPSAAGEFRVPAAGERHRSFRAADGAGPGARAGARPPPASSR